MDRNSISAQLDPVHPAAPATLLLDSSATSRPHTRLGTTRPPGRPPPGAVNVGIEFAALNRIDRMIMRGRVPVPTTPHVLGGEAAGIVTEAGPGVTTPRVGERVMLFPYAGCSTCARCEEGNPTLCRDARLAGVTAPGYFRRFVQIRADDAVPVGGIEPQFAAVALTVALAWHVLVCRGDFKTGERVSIAPLASGLGAACGAVAYAMDAQVLGIASHETLDALRDHPPWLWETWCADHPASRSPSKVDLAIDAAGSSLGLGHQILGVGGRLVSVGAHGMEGPVPLDLWRLFTREQEIRGSHGCHREDVRAGLRALRSIQNTHLIDSVFDISNYIDAYKRLDRRGKLGKVLLRLAAWEDSDA